MPNFHLHPEIWALFAALGLAYLWMVRAVGPRKVHAIERPVSRRQVLWFTLGLATLAVASGWPIHDLAEGQLYSAHMVQHMLYTLVAPPLLILGMPDWMIRSVLGRWGIAAAKFLGRPLVALAAFNGMIALSHLPGVVDLSVRSAPFHFLVHLLLVATAFMMWSPVLNPLIELPKLSYPGRMFYLFLQSLVPTVPASFLTFGHGVLYPAYATPPHIWGVTPLTDQRTAGLIMKLVAGFLLWAVIAWYFFKWWQTEERENVDVFEWSKLEGRTRELTKQ
jgi:putative membrane protein